MLKNKETVLWGGGVVIFGNGFKIINYDCYNDDENMDKNDVNNNKNSNNNIHANNDNNKKIILMEYQIIIQDLFNIQKS